MLGASGGIGSAVARTLSDDPDCTRIETLSRSTDEFDVTDEASVAAAATRLGDEPFDLIFNATGALEVDQQGPEKAFKEIGADIMTRAFQVNAVGGALVYKYFLPLLRSDGPTRFAALSARVGSIGDNNLGGWTSYRASKAALNQITRCAAIEFARSNKEAVIAALHPGTIETPLTKKYAKGRYTATADECAHNLLSVLGNLTPEQSGGFFDYAGKEIAW